MRTRSIPLAVFLAGLFVIVPLASLPVSAAAQSRVSMHAIALHSHGHSAAVKSRIATHLATDTAPVDPPNCLFTECEYPAGSGNNYFCILGQPYTTINDCHTFTTVYTNTGLDLTNTGTVFPGAASLASAAGPVAIAAAIAALPAGITVLDVAALSAASLLPWLPAGAIAAAIAGVSAGDIGILTAVAIIPVAGALALGTAAAIAAIACGGVGFACHGSDITENFITHPELQTGPVGQLIDIGWSLPSPQILSSPVAGTAGVDNVDAPQICVAGRLKNLAITWDGDIHTDLEDYSASSSTISPLLNTNNLTLIDQPGGGLAVEMPLNDRGNFSVLTQLRGGQILQICGPWVTDSNHNEAWNEIHPVTSLTIVSDFSVAASPSDVTVQAGGSASFSTSVTLNSGPADPVALDVTGLPSGAAASFNPSSVSGTGGSALTVSTSVTGGLGDFPLTIRGQGGGGVTFTASVTLHVYDYSVALSPADRTVLRGGSTAYGVTLRLLAGSTTIGIPALSLSQSGLPPDSTASFGSGTLTPTAVGVSTGLSISTASSPAGSLGDFTFHVSGTNPGGTARAGSAVLHLWDYSLTVAPATQQVLTTGSNTYSVNVTVLPGSSTTGLPPIGLTVSGLPAGATGSFTPGSGAGSFASTLTINTVSTPAGSSTLTLTGTDSRSPEGGARSVMATLVVLTPQQGLGGPGGQVDALRTSGVLNSGQARSFTAKLDAARASLTAGRTTAACNQLSAFVNEVNAYVSAGMLTQAQADSLLGGPLGVTAIMAAIPC